MTFLHGGAMWGWLALAGIPLFIHWLSRRFPRVYIFSSLDDIKKTMAGRTRISRWRHYLFLLLRTLALIALILAFFKPVVGLDDNNESAEGQRHVIVLLDHSQSMAHSDGAVSSFQRARLEVEKLIKGLDPLDKLNIILVGRSPKPAFGEFSHNTAAALKFLREAAPVPQEADYHAANALAAQFSSKAEGPLEFYYASDFQRKNWANVQFEELPPEARLFFLPATEDTERGNLALLDVALPDRDPVTGSSFEVKVRIGNYSKHHFNGKVEAVVQASVGTEAAVALPPWGETDLILEIPALAPGQHGIDFRLTPDDLSLDNTRTLSVHVHESEEVLILTDPGDETDPSPPARYLSAAVNPYDAKAGAYRPRVINAKELTPSTLAACSKVVASRSPALSDSQIASLSSFLRGGGGLLLFLDGEHDPANFEKLNKQLTDELPLRLNSRLTADNLPSGAMRIAQGDFRSPFLRHFKGERRTNLGFLEFYEFYSAAPTGEGRVLLRFADGTPAMTESQAGLGTILLCNFSVSELSSNLARQRLFPGWIHDLLSNMSAVGGEEMTFLAGDRIYTELWASEALGRPIIGPDRKEVPSEAEVRGERVHFNFTAEDPGSYRMAGPGGRTLAHFAVNTPTRESDLRTLDISILPERAPAGQERATLLRDAGTYHTLKDGTPVFWWFLLAALAFFFLEALLNGFLGLKRKPATA